MANDTVQHVKTLAVQAWEHELDSRAPCQGRKEPTPQNCSLTFVSTYHGTCTYFACMCGYTHRNTHTHADTFTNTLIIKKFKTIKVMHWDKSWSKISVKIKIQCNHNYFNAFRAETGNQNIYIIGSIVDFFISILFVLLSKVSILYDFVIEKSTYHEKNNSNMENYFLIL